MRAIYNCAADSPDELTFSEGELIVVDGEEDSEWWVSEKRLQHRKRIISTASFTSQHLLQHVCAFRWKPTWRTILTRCPGCDLTTVCVSDRSHRKRSDQAGSVSSHLCSLPVGVIRASNCGQTEGTSGSSCGPERRVRHPKRSDWGLDLHSCSSSKSVGLSLKCSKSYAADTKRADQTKSMWTVFFSDTFTHSRATLVQRLHRQRAGTTAEHSYSKILHCLKTNATKRQLCFFLLPVTKPASFIEIIWLLWKDFIFTLSGWPHRHSVHILLADVMYISVVLLLGSSCVTSGTFSLFVKASGWNDFYYFKIKHVIWAENLSVL